ncbi:hypothetical protein HA135_07230 [Mycobacteroides chelonae]|nr:hypothetical protein [Mycobacteroides chelonae]
MAACEEVGLRWGETSITEMVLSRTARTITVAPFTQRAESISGADWIWWWLDDTAAYGMLVQAKRLVITAGRWRFDFEYPRGSGVQRARLMSTAAALDLVPVYAIYLGTADYRGWEPCPDRHTPEGCVSCTKRTLSLMPAILARDMYTYSAAVTYACSIALEDVRASRDTRGAVPPTLLPELAPELYDFLTTRQRGVLGVSRAMIDRVLKVRAGQFGALAAPVETVINGGHDDLGRIFPQVPADTGHWGFPYFNQILDPLKHAPPDYVLALESGAANADEIASVMPEDAAGIVVVRTARNG